MFMFAYIYIYVLHTRKVFFSFETDFIFFTYILDLYIVFPSISYCLGNFCTTTRPELHKIAVISQ
jgi:hypothetical protein